LEEVVKAFEDSISTLKREGYGTAPLDNILKQIKK
jgi:hypothetical protein